MAPPPEQQNRLLRTAWHHLLCSLYLFVLITARVTAQETPQAPHPFLQDSHYPAWSRMTPQQLRTDAQEGIRRANAHIDNILNLTPRTATIANTFGAYHQATADIDQLVLYCFHLYTAHNISPELTAELNTLMPAINSCRARLTHTPHVRSLLEHVAQTPAAQNATEADKRLINHTLRQLPPPLTPAQQQQLAAMQQELRNLGTQYEANIRHVEQTWHYVFTRSEQLTGTPPHTLARMEQAARQHGFSTATTPAWLITPNTPAIRDVLKHCTVAATRKKCWQGIHSCGNTPNSDNGPIATRILQLRHNIATLQGYPNHADFKLKDYMMRNGQNALRLINNILQQLRPQIEAERATLLRLATEHYGHPVSALHPWDIDFLRTQLSKQHNHFSSAELRPYLELNHTLTATFAYFGKLYGLSIEEQPAACISPAATCPPGHTEVWAPGVRVFTVTDTATQQHYGTFYLDAYTRPGKNTGARSQILRTGISTTPPDNAKPHLAALMLELQAPPPGSNSPTLLSHLELRMLLHELGHTLHLLLGRGPNLTDSADQQALDFIELPALLHEHWAWDPQYLCTIARHHQTGAPLPHNLAQKISQSHHSNNASTISSLLISMLDLEMHLHYPQQFHNIPIDTATHNLLSPWQPPQSTTPPSPLRNLPHCFSIGYDATFYSYILAELMAADIFDTFRQHGIHNPALGRSYRKTILEPGNSAHPTQLYRNFMGRPPAHKAYLQQLLPAQ